MRHPAKLSVGAVVLLVGALLAPAARGTFPGPNGRIAFERGGNIWVMNPNGTGQTRLTRSGTAAHPQWSADGRKIAYDQASQGTGRGVWVMAANGSGKYRVTSHVANEVDPAWSPDGRWLAFVSDRRGRGEIFKVRSTAPFGKAIRLTDTAGTGEPFPTEENPRLSDSQPSWSPAGDRIAFSRYSRSDDSSAFAYTYLLATMDADGTDVLEAPTTFLASTCPAWGPGGVKVAWVDDEWEFAGGASNVWHSNPDRSATVNVTNFDPSTLWHLGCASWSPDRGKSIVFSGFVDSGDPTLRPRIYRVASSGASPPTLIARNGADPDWGRSPG
jgi:Tol biopolymer transport system component